MDLFDRAPPSDETLEGTVERVVFAGGGAGAFTVARLRVESRADLVTIVGPLLGVPAGARLRLRGRHETDPRFGPQFRVASYTEVAPQTLEGLRRYLGSGLIKGIGPEFASRIVERFGIKTLEILDAEPHRIGQVPGIGRVRAEAIKKAWATQREIRNVMVFLQGHGVSPAFAVRIYKKYGAAAVARVRENPYRLAFDVWGIGFLSADRLAGALGIKRDADVRVEAGVRHGLDEAGTAGHVFLPRARLVEEAARRLEVDAALVEAAVDRLAAAGDVAIERTTAELGSDAVYDAGLHRAERAAAAGIERLLSSSKQAPAVDLDRAVEWYEREAGIALASQQA